MRTRALAALLALLAAPVPAAQDDAEQDGAAAAGPLEIEARVVLAGDGTRWRDPSAEPPHPGETLALALAWPEGTRPERPSLAPGSDAASDAAVRTIGLVPRLAAAGHEDVVLVLPLQLGEITVPTIEIRDERGRTVARTREVTLEIAPALAEGDTEPAPARPPAAISPDVWGLAIAAAVAALLAAAAVWLLRRMRRRVPEEPEAPAPPPVPAHVTALAELDELLRSNLLARGALKPFSVRLAEIGKRYVSARAGVSLLERTTAECERLLSKRPGVNDQASWLVGWLGALDLVKFANDRPQAATLTGMAEDLRTFIHDAEAAKARVPERPRDEPPEARVPGGGADGAPKPWPAPGGASP